MAPLSVLYNWKDELDTWGHFRVVVVHGVKKDEELVRVQRGRCEIALTTYETLRICLDQFNRYIVDTELSLFHLFMQHHVIISSCKYAVWGSVRFFNQR